MPLEKRIGVRRTDTDRKPCEINTKDYVKMGVCEQFSDDNNMKNRTSSTSKVRNTQCGQHQIANDAAHCFQTPRNIVAILEQLSNYNMLLREQIEIKKSGFVKKNALSNDEIRHKSKSCASASEHVPKMQHDKSNGDDNEDDNAWIDPKKSMSMTCFFKKCKKEEEIEKVNDERSMLIDECEDDEDKECEKKCHNANKEDVRSVVKVNDSDEKTKAIESNGANVEHKEVYEK